MNYTHIINVICCQRERSGTGVYLGGAEYDLNTISVEKVKLR
jgi:hypothetical protein